MKIQRVHARMASAWAAWRHRRVGSWRVGAFMALIVSLLGLSRNLGWDVVAAQRINAQPLQWTLALEPHRPFDAERGTGPLEAEALLRWAHELLKTGDRAQALEVAQHLTEKYPDFQLGQLLLADLLTLASAPSAGPLLARLTDDALVARVRELNQEAELRLGRPEQPVYAGKEPAGLAHVSPEVSHVVVVDARHSRLYLLENHSTAQQRDLRVVFETYMSVGRNGIGKAQRGDGRTPIGLYVIEKSLPGHVLPDLYGSGALTLNYPNDLDHLRGKTGSGIWIHGSPTGQFARAPESTDGCVVLSNPDMSKLMSLRLAAGTPVLIVRQLEWVNPEHNRSLYSKLARAMGPVPDAGDGMARAQPLAWFSWHDEGQQLVSVLYPPEDKPTTRVGPSTARAPVAQPRYWHEQSGQWQLAEQTVAPPRQWSLKRSTP